MAYLIGLDKRFGCSCNTCAKVLNCKAKPVVKCVWYEERNK